MSEAITPLHVRSGYSLLRGPSSVASLVERAERLGYGRLALTDVNGLYGATVFFAEAAAAGLRPITGAELRQDERSVVALVEAESGYENLCRLITRLRCPGDFHLPGDLASLADGLHFLVEDAALAADLLTGGLPPGRLWLGFDPATQPPRRVRQLADLAAARDLPLTATGKAMFARSDEFDVAGLLAAVRLGETYDNVQPHDLPHPKACLRAPVLLAKQLVAAPQALDNNRRLAERCAEYSLLPRRTVFPTFPVPDGRSARRYLAELCRIGAGRRYRGNPPAGLAGRLSRELTLIERKGFCEYFLVVWDIVRFARRRGVPVAGRGSGASSVVAYLLGVTNICPLTYDIPFERFLNEGRRDFPDLDVDFCWRIRDDVIDYAFRRWGRDRTAMVCMHNTFQAASALRETAKAFGLSDEQISRMAAEGWQVQREPGDRTDRGARIVALAESIAGLAHNISVHPGGIVIAPRRIDSYAPIEPAAKGVNVTQYDKDGIEAIGLVKLDLLGNRSLSTIREACDLVAGRTGRRIDVEALPPADEPTIAMLRAGETVGCNQLESPAMRHLLRGLRPGGVGDLMKALALIRPGAAGISMKDEFIRRHRGLSPVPKGFGPVDWILAAGHGVMLYEDDVMLTAAAMLATSPAEADRFRRAVQKCHDDEHRAALSREFLARCRANGVGLEYAKEMWVQMAKFNAYSFCRAHAGSYAILAYVVAYLKRHYPWAFWVAALNNNQSMYPHRVYVEQAKRAGVRFSLPDVNRSEAEFSLDGEAILAGFGRIAGLGPAGAEGVLNARGSGEFVSLSDFVFRASLSRPAVRSLILCGAFDSFGLTRPALMMELRACAAAPSAHRAGQRLLLPAGPAIGETGADYSPRRKFFDEWRMLGFSTGRHVMSWYRDDLRPRVDTDSRQLRSRIGRRVRIAGMREALRATKTRTGRRMIFLTMDDEYGLFEATVFPDAARRVPRSFSAYGPYVVSGRLEQQHDSVVVAADRVVPCPRPRDPVHRRKERT